MEISDYAHYAVFLHWLHSLRCFISLLLKWNIWLRSLRCFSSLTTLTTQFYFTTINWKSLTTLTTLFYFHHYWNEVYVGSLRCLSSLLLKWNIWLSSPRCFYFQCYWDEFSNYAHYAVLLHYSQKDISDYAHYTVLISLLLKWNFWLRSLHCITLLLLILALPSLRCSDLLSTK